MVLATYYELLKEYVSFKTVHDTTTFSFEAEKTIKWLSDLFMKHQFEVKEYSTYDIPLLLATHIQNKNLPTALIYTYYDLPLIDISPNWKNNPYNLYLGKEEIIGRGVAENKGQFMLYLTTMFHLLQHNQLGYNVIFLIDGTQHKV
ncbi:MAG: hypothetical protein LBG59_00025 [Candidatus Peribacteria bacterium]|jgi:acetylornithine deacetylase/succinyl-diaminopimelate desuccinylase-like protein|nr:hypothetical protein [Candidatus Peribacteria bacterium]